jgi:hypothetical protein
MTALSFVTHAGAVAARKGVDQMTLEIRVTRKQTNELVVSAAISQ